MIISQFDNERIDNKKMKPGFFLTRSIYALFYLILITIQTDLMIKVLRILNRFNLGGPTYNAALLTKYLPAEYETLLIGGDKEESEGSSMHILENLGITPVIIPEMQRSISPKNDRIAYKKIKKIIKEFKPDIVHTHASKAGTLGRIAAVRCKVPVIVHTFHGHVFHSYFNKTKTAAYKNIERHLAKRSSAIVTISAIQKEELSVQHRVCKASKTHIIPLGFDLNKFNENTGEKRKNFRTEYNVKDNEVAIGIIGRLVPIKNHSLFLKSISRLKELTKQPIKVFIVGDGECLEFLQKECDDLNLKHAYKSNDAEIIFTSWITDVDRVNAGLDIITLTSYNEGTPVSLIEAQASGKPIVTTNVGGIENVVQPNKSAFLTQNNDFETFAQHLNLLVENKSLREKMGVAGQASAFENFSYERLCSDMDALYKKLL